jgi:hypothetical protein
MNSRILSGVGIECRRAVRGLAMATFLRAGIARVDALRHKQVAR